MYEVHIRQKNPDNTTEISGMILPRQFETIADIRNYLQQLLANLELVIIDVETGQVVQTWKPKS